MTTTDEAPRRMTVSRMAELLATRPARGSESSVSVTRNAKGQYQFAVEVTHPDPAEAARLAGEIADHLEGRYPYLNGDA